MENIGFSAQPPALVAARFTHVTMLGFLLFATVLFIYYVYKRAKILNPDFSESTMFFRPPKRRISLVDAELTLRPECVKRLYEARVCEEVECPICFSEANHAVITDCGHIYCCECIHRFWKHSAPPIKPVHCPICRNGVRLLLPIAWGGESSNCEVDEDLKKNDDLLNDYNSRFVGTRTWVDLLHDVPSVVHFSFGNFFEGLGLLSQIRTVFFLAVILFPLVPSSAFSQQLYSVIGLIDDLFVLAIIVYYCGREVLERLSQDDADDWPTLIMVAQDLQNDENLVDTAITWGMVEQDLQKQLKTNARTGSGRAVRILNGGYVSKTCFVTFDWTEDRERLPAEGVMKITSSAGMKLLSKINNAFERFDEMATCMGNTEFNFLQHAEASGFASEVPVCRFIGGRLFGVDGIEAGYTILEAIDDIHNLHVFDELSEYSTMEGVQILARIAAYSLRNPEGARTLSENEVFDEFFSDFIRPEKLEKGFVHLEERFPDKLRELETIKTQMKHLKSVGTFKRFMDATCKFPIIVHGDMWPGNILWQKTEDGDYGIRVVADWQTTHLGNPLEDLTRFLSTSLSAKDYNERRDHYLHAYYDTLTELASGCELPWPTFDELVECYEKVFTLIVINWSHVFLQTLSEEVVVASSEKEGAARLEILHAKYRNMFDRAACYVQKMVAENLDPNERIVDTVVTWGLVEADLQKQFDTLAKIGPNREARLLNGGYVSKTALLTFDWTEEEARLPKCGVMKVTSAAGMKAISDLNGSFVNFEVMATSFGDTECNFLKVAPKVGFSAEIPVCRFIGGKLFGVDGVEAGYTIMEMVEGAHYRHVFHILSEAPMVEVMQMLGRMAGYSLRHPNEAGMLAENRVFEEFFGDFARPQKIDEGFTAMETRFPSLQAEVDVLKTQKIYFESVAKFKKRMDEACNVRTIVHGDMWPGNILWNIGKDGEYGIRKVVDWQTTHLGNPLEDLTRILSTGLSAEDHRNKRDFFLNIFYTTMEEEADGKKLPWESFEELVEQYEKIFPLIAIVWVPPFILVLTDEVVIGGGGEEGEALLPGFLAKYENMIAESADYILRWGLDSE
ncbi:unnamed protein product, partial [Mesorhabditis spiculigera]